MSQQLPILYADSVCNPTAGCTGCELWNSARRTCHAGIEHQVHGATRQGYSPSFGEITFWTGRTKKAACLSDLRGLGRDEKPWLDGMPRMILLSNLGDMLCEAIPFEYLRAEVISAVTSLHGGRHLWLWPTKKPTRLADFSLWLDQQGEPWPSNLAVGTSITTAETMGRITDLLQVGDEETLRFVLAQPQLGPLDLRPWLSKIGLVVQGGECGRQPGRFDVRWAQEMYQQCQEANVAYFLAQLGGYVFRGEERIRLSDRHGADWSEWPDDVPRVRQVPTEWGGTATTDLGDLPEPGHFSTGNDKLDSGIFDWAMTPIAACPGCKHALCSELRPDGKASPLPICFGCRGRFREDRMKERLKKNFQFAKSDLFVPWANEFLPRHRQRIQAVRIPGIGDLFSIDFINKVQAIVVANPDVKFFCNTRVWCVPELWAEVVRKLKPLPNLTIWLSWDRKMAAHNGTPPDRDLPWSWLAETDDDLPPEPVTLVYRYEPFSVWNYKPPELRTLGACVVCPHEDGVSKTTCSLCGICWRGDDFRRAKIAHLLHEAEAASGVS